MSSLRKISERIYLQDNNVVKRNIL